MPTYPNIERYYAYLRELIEAGGSDNELSIRPAFQNCLAAYCTGHRERLTLVPELRAPGGIPDGTVKDSLRMARGYWEAKDPHDSLDAEIQAKFSQGYPKDNILFEDSREAVLFKNGAEAMRVEMTDPGSVHWQAIDRLRAYYRAIGRAAYEIAEYAEKQRFLKAGYEDFYKAYCPAADRLGWCVHTQLGGSLLFTKDGWCND